MLELQQALQVHLPASRPYLKATLVEPAALVTTVLAFMYSKDLALSASLKYYSASYRGYCSRDVQPSVLLNILLEILLVCR